MDNYSIYKNEKNNQFTYYYCKKCGEIPILHFFKYNVDIICSMHKILNIPIDQFYNFIFYDYICSICNNTSKENEKNFFHCYDCKKYYCNKCIKCHNQYKENSHMISNVDEKFIKCKLHNKKYNKFCIKCKLNLCELCEIHNNHCIEYFKDIYPSNNDIIEFKQLANNILSNCKDDNKLKELIKIKLLFINSFSDKITNYNYIININNIIRCTIPIYNNNININNNIIKYIDDIKPKKDINNIENKILIKSMDKNKTNDSKFQTLCIKKLNDIQINPQKNLELIAIGGANYKILLLNIINFDIYQIIEEHKGSVYSLDQYKNDSNLLFSSSNDKTINIYTLNYDYKYVLVQKLKKSEGKGGEEINKIICLSNKLLVSGDHRSITIWKSNIQAKNSIYYEDIHEIIINRDTCHLLEINLSIFIASQINYFQVYKNDGKNFPLIGELANVKNHGGSSNGLAKINDKLVCSSSISLFYIICIEPLQIIQKFQMFWERSFTIYYIYVTKDNYLYCKGDFQSILQYKIINDKDNNFVELIEIGKLCGDKNYSMYDKAILPFDDGRIFFVEEKEGETYYQLIA